MGVITQLMIVKSKPRELMDLNCEIHREIGIQIAHAPESDVEITIVSKVSQASLYLLSDAKPP
jgi:hypothetical protein